MAHLALYRKYRSQTFDELAGQEHITRALKSAIDSDRLAHAYLFVGPRGTGKTSAARILAKCLCCEKGPTPTPCLECRPCTTIARGEFTDVLEMDAASEAGVDEVRSNIIERAQYAPLEADRKVYIIDEVHDLSAKAFDALLKTIEEPPPHVVFILATTEYNKVPLTIRSRCQQYRFHRGSVEEIESQLKLVCEQESLQFEVAGLQLIARMADGAYRDGLTLLEQVALTNADGITADAVIRQLGLIPNDETDSLLAAAVDGDVASLLTRADGFVRGGREPSAVIESLLLRLSDLTRAAYGAESDSETSAQSIESDRALATKIGKNRLLRFRKVLADSHSTIRDVTLPRLWLELCLTRLVEVPTDAPPPKATAPKKPEPRKATMVKASPPPEPATHDSEEAAWSAALAELRKKFKSAGKMLDGTAARRREDGNIAIVFPKNNRFQYERLHNGEKSDELQRHIRAALAAKLKGPEFMLTFEVENGQEPAESAVESSLEGEDLEKAAAEVFLGE